MVLSRLNFSANKIPTKDVSRVLDCMVVKSSDGYAVARQNAVHAIAMLAEHNVIPEDKIRLIISTVVDTLSEDEDGDVRRRATCIITRLAQHNNIPESQMIVVGRCLNDKLNDSYNLVKTWACMAISFICQRRECDGALIVGCIEVLLSLVEDDYRAVEALCSFVQANKLGDSQSLEEKVGKIIFAANELGDLFYQDGVPAQRRREISTWLRIAVDRFVSDGKVGFLVYST